jgi:hypothetical protein
MAELYRFFASTPTDTREYNQEDWATVIAGLSGDGVIARVGNRLEVIPTTPNTMAIIVKDGAAWLQGYWYQNTVDKEITIPAADVSYARYDRIVLRLDKFIDRKIEAMVKVGTPSSSPSPPALEQTSDYWEISLAKIYVPANITSIDSTKITDEREMVAHALRQTAKITEAMLEKTLYITENAQTGTTYTLVIDDDHKLVSFSNSSAITLTIPTNKSVAFPVGTQILILQKGTGQVTIGKATGVTVNSVNGANKTVAQYSMAGLIKLATDTWILFGDLEA